MTFAKGLGSRGTSKDKTSLSNPTQGKLVPPADVSNPLQYRVRASAPQDGPLTRCAILTFNRHSE
jgi:hypothetical protein